jgi:CubicO group peptidase (beta-lactamase class C family)
LVSTVAESLAFLRGFFEGKLFDAGHLPRMTRRWNSLFFPIQYGYGLMRIKMPRVFSPFKPSAEFIGHSGASGSFAFAVPARGLYLAGTVNQAQAPGRPIRLMMHMENALG